MALLEYTLQQARDPTNAVSTFIISDPSREQEVLETITKKYIELSRITGDGIFHPMAEEHGLNFGRFVNTNPSFACRTFDPDTGMYLYPHLVTEVGRYTTAQYLDSEGVSCSIYPANDFCINRRSPDDYSIFVTMMHPRELSVILGMAQRDLEPERDFDAWLAATADSYGVKLNGNESKLDLALKLDKAGRALDAFEVMWGIPFNRRADGHTIIVLYYMKKPEETAEKILGGFS